MKQVLEHYGLLEKFKEGKDSLSGPCPIHKGSNPTQFRVSVSKNIWNCFSECKHGGNTLDFIAKMEGVSIHAAALKAIGWFRLDPEAMAAKTDETDEEQPESTSKEALPQTKDPSHQPHVHAEGTGPNRPLKFRLDKLEREHLYLLETRGLTPQTIEEFGIGFCAKGMMADRIAIPIRNPQGEVVAYAGRFIGDPPGDVTKYKLPPGFKKSLEIFNLDRALKESVDLPLVVVGGFFDTMKVRQNGHRKVAGLMQNTMSAAQEDLLRQHVDRNSRVILMLPENDVGRAAREDIACRISTFCFVKIHVFEKEDMQPEQLTKEELDRIIGTSLRPASSSANP